MDTPTKLRFGVFLADLRAGELYKRGARLRLPGQPFQVLALLLERQGDVVTREELRQRLWPKDVFVDFDQSLNKAVNRIREALGDSADSPRFVETLPRRGYRFLAPVERVEPGSEPAHPDAPAPLPDQEVVATTPAPPRVEARRARTAALALLAAAAALTGALYLAARAGREPVAPAPGGKLMLAVLPFDNLSGDPEHEYFADGMTEEMIAQLGRLRPERLGVIARTSAMQYKHTHKAVDQIARELAVGYLVEGSVRRDAGRVRITVQLIQAADQTHLWADSYERDVADVLAIQTDVARRVASSLALELLPDRREALARLESQSSAAHDACLQGRYHWNKRTEAGLRKSLESFQQAIAIDPFYAPGYAGLADAYNVLADYALIAPKEAGPRAQAAASKALALDPTLAEAHAALAYSRWNFEWDWTGAEREFQRALALDPGYAVAHQWYGTYLGQLGRFDEALDQMRLARQLDPVSRIIGTNLGALHYFARRYDEAIRICRQTLELDAEFPVALWLLGRAHEARGELPQALSAFERAIAASDSPTYVAARARVLALSGDAAQARSLLETLHRLSERRYVSAFDLALVHGALGETQASLDWLERAYASRSNALADLKVDPRLDPLRSEPRFQALVRRVGIPSPAIQPTS
jgi:TolB-like protein/DNA-binding winged helix-turn-helix (wHTH) protein/Tfp pilus assembly protein PilF